jgi:F-type H+-transporting ATPase subunit epsilon
MSFELVIVTPFGEAYRGQVESVVLPGSEGEFGVLARHERFLSPLDIGEAQIRTGAGTTFAALASGFAQVEGDRVTLLVESCEVGSDIDAARAMLARDRAREGLARLGVDAGRERIEEFEAALARAENRLRVSQRS